MAQFDHTETMIVKFDASLPAVAVEQFGKTIRQIIEEEPIFGMKNVSFQPKELENVVRDAMKIAKTFVQFVHVAVQMRPVQWLMVETNVQAEMSIEGTSQTKERFA